MDAISDLISIANENKDGGPRLLPASGSPGLFDGLTLKRIDEALASGLLGPSQVSLARNGHTALRKQYVRAFQYPGVDLPEALDYGRVMKSVSDGYTLILYACDQWLSDLGREMAALRARSGHPAIAVIFITPASEVGLEIHEDPLDTFVFQLAGTKTWEVFDRPPGWMTKGYLPREQVGEARLQATLSVGDALYIPRGCPHVARADSLSMHLSIGIGTLTVRALLTALMGRRDLLPLEFDRAIPFATQSGAPLGDLLRQAVDALVGRLGSQSWPDVLDQVVGPRPPVWEPGALERLSFEEAE